MSQARLQGIGKTGVNIVRVGRPEAIREDVKSYALDGRWKEQREQMMLSRDFGCGVSWSGGVGGRDVQVEPEIDLECDCLELWQGTES